MKTLKALRVIAKIAEILSRIAFVCCIVVAASCLVGIVCLLVGAPILRVSGITIESLLKTQANLSIGTLTAAMASVAILSAGSGVEAGFAAHYFKRAQADGTPFCLEGAKELFRLGILSIAIPFGSMILAQIVQAVLTLGMQNIEPLSLNFGSSISIGVLYLVMSLICRYGTELLAKKDAAEE